MHVHDLIPRYGFTLWHCTWTCQSVSVQVNGWCPRSALASLAGCENECQEESESRGAFGSMTHHDPSSGISMKFDQAFHNNYFTIFHIYFTVCNAHPLHGNGSTATVPRGSCDARVGGWMCSTAADGGDWRRRFAQGTCFWFRIDEILGGIHDWKLLNHMSMFFICEEITSGKPCNQKCVVWPSAGGVPIGVSRAVYISLLGLEVII